MDRYSGLGLGLCANLETRGCAEGLWIVGGFPDAFSEHNNYLEEGTSPVLVLFEKVSPAS